MYKLGLTLEEVFHILRTSAAFVFYTCFSGIMLSVYPSHASEWVYFCIYPEGENSCRCSDIRTAELPSQSKRAGEEAELICKSEFGAHVLTVGQNKNAFHGAVGALRKIRNQKSECDCSGLFAKIRKNTKPEDVKTELGDRPLKTKKLPQAFSSNELADLFREDMAKSFPNAVDPRDANADDTDSQFDGFETIDVRATGKAGTTYRNEKTAKDVAAYEAGVKAQKECKERRGTIVSKYRVDKEQAVSTCNCSRLRNNEYHCNCTYTATCAIRNLTPEEELRLKIVEQFAFIHSKKIGKMFVSAKKGIKTGVVTKGYFDKISEAYRQVTKLKQGLKRINDPRAELVYVHDLEALQSEISSLIQ